MIGEDVDVRIEVFDDHVMIIFPRPIQDISIPWQQAWILGDVLEKAAGDIPNKGIIGPVAAEIESHKLRLRTYRNKYVVLLCDHTDRVKLSYEAARIVARSIKMKAQDLDFLVNKGVRIIVEHGHFMPYWDYKQRIFKTS